MGTYYKAVNTDRKEFMEPSTFGQTLKLQEFTEDPAGIMEALAILLAENERGGIEGRWAGDRVLFASVYGQEDEDGLTLYRRVGQDPSYLDVGPHVLKHMVRSEITRQRLIERARHKPSARLRSVLNDLGVIWREAAGE